MTAKPNPPQTGSPTKANDDAGMALPQTRAVRDLVLGDIIRVDRLEDDQVVRNAQRIRTGLDAGLVHVTLVARDGDRERIALAPEERVIFVGKAAEAGRSKSGSQAKAKGNANVKGRPAPQAAATPAPGMEATTAQRRRHQQAAGAKPMSCLEAAARLLAETGQALSCQELIAALAAKGSWTSPAGKTPQATLYAALVREIRTQKEHARFRKTAPGRFARA